jgi:hypothetical protein
VGRKLRKMYDPWHSVSPENGPTSLEKFRMMLMDRAAPGNRERARRLLDEGLETYTRIGMRCAHQLVSGTIRSPMPENIYDGGLSLWAPLSPDCVEGPLISKVPRSAMPPSV